MSSSSGRSLRRNSPAAGHRSFRWPPRGSSPSPNRRASPASPRRRRWISSDPIDALPKCSSAPLLPGTTSGGREEESPSSVPEGWLYRPMTCTDVFSPQFHMLSSEHLQIPQEGYQKDAKVVVTVAVEGSTGPIRAMVKLGSSVEETIKLVIDKYDKEGRSPRLNKTSSSYDLHLSYFSLESLDRQDFIGNIGSRNFYLRKGRRYGESNASEMVDSVERQPITHQPPVVFLPSHINRKLTKLMRRIRKLWKVLGCFLCTN